MVRRAEPVAPDSVIGRNTVASIQSGLVWGFVAQVEGMVARMAAELGGSTKVVATGGQAALVAGLTHVIQTTDPLLTLEGLRLIYAQNANGRQASKPPSRSTPTSSATSTRSGPPTSFPRSARWRSTSLPPPHSPTP